ncbi:Hypothetical predicted protein, partial [Paramuricea clavata]
DQLICYVHDITPMKSGSMSYMTCNLQTSTSKLKAVCSSPEKSNPLKKASAGRSPIKIKKFDFSSKFNNVVINKHTVIEDYKEPIGFSCADPSALVTLSSVHGISPGQMVTLKANVTQMSGVKHVKIDNGTLKQVMAILVDPTASIQAVFWEEWVGSIEDRKTYIFTNMRLREDNYTNEKFVNTAKSGCKIGISVPFSEALPDVTLSLSEMATKEVTISVVVVGVKVLSNFFTCQSCSKKLEECGTKYILCRPCNMKQKPINIQWYCKLRVQETLSQQFNLSVFHPQLMKLLETQGRSLLPTLTNDQIEDILLDVEGPLRLA